MIVLIVLLAAALTALSIQFRRHQTWAWGEVDDLRGRLDSLETAGNRVVRDILDRLESIEDAEVLEDRSDRELAADLLRRAALALDHDDDGDDA